jgi:hypothetical protein
MKYILLIFTALLFVFLRYYASGQTTPPAPPTFTVNVSQLDENKKYVADVANNMPAWDNDYLGQFERNEITLVKEDIEVCNSDETADDFMIDAEKLKTDARTLYALDDALKIEKVI